MLTHTKKINVVLQIIPKGSNLVVCGMHITGLVESDPKKITLTTYNITRSFRVSGKGTLAANSKRSCNIRL